MSGPGLTRRESHHAIHEAAFAEAEELTRLLRQAALITDQTQALQLAGVLMEHWQTRTLRHATAEEQGWYRDLVSERPDLRIVIEQLTRDHDLLRMLLGEIEQIIAARGWVSGIVERFEAMLLLNAIHSREEEQRLLGGKDSADTEQAANTKPTARVVEGARDGSTPDDIPLAVAHPQLYRQGIERLGKRGINPGDLRLATLYGTSSNDTRLRVTFGRGFAEVYEAPLPDVADQAEVERVFDAIADACERTVRSEYYESMQIVEPGAPGGRSGKQARFNLTVLNQPKESAL